MKNKKKILVALTLSLVMGGVVSASARSLISEQSLTMFYVDSDTRSNYANACDAYVKVQNSGSIFEDHWFKGGIEPRNFTGELQQRTAWYKPNIRLDFSTNVNGYNESGFIEEGQEVRTEVTGYGVGGGIGVLGLNYEN